MYWNYRVLKENDKYRIIDVTYKDGKISTWCDSHQSRLVWNSYDDLEKTVEMIQKAFSKPVLELTENGLVEVA